MGIVSIQYNREKTALNEVWRIEGKLLLLQSIHVYRLYMSARTHPANVYHNKYMALYLITAYPFSHGSSLSYEQEIPFSMPLQRTFGMYTMQFA